MGSDWRDPEWKEQGRTGPGPFAPKYTRQGRKMARKKNGMPKARGGGCVVVVLPFLALSGTAMYGVAQLFV